MLRGRISTHATCRDAQYTMTYMLVLLHILIYVDTKRYIPEMWMLVTPQILSSRSLCLHLPSLHSSKRMYLISLILNQQCFYGSRIELLNTRYTMRVSLTRNNIYTCRIRRRTICSGKYVSIIALPDQGMLCA